ncbi:hypothetical protein LTR36_004347 [Oleoguttula mirabilis]|uniref:Uncharacterized protein n=1 Tax=Oleoguttula mirabilis TaxID=1507867 RepID=A0AAV9JIY2_9PEZI|nr:hypothetical protein LTR36_004347 [Oleoguttula mirabilis]
MAYARPVVLEGASLPDLVQYVLDKHEGLSTLVVCGTKQAFLEYLIAASTTSNQDGDILCSTQQHSDDRRPAFAIEALRQASQLWTVPTLRSLATSRMVKLAFCPDITHLRAYLATYTRRAFGSTDQTGAQDEKHILAILNLIQLHRPTSAFSAQGLNRTFSAAVEAAYRTQSQLVITECPAGALVSTLEHAAALHDEEMPPPPEHPASQSLWDKEVSILNVTTKSFGAGERGWVGRTVKLRTIAERWCTFEMHLHEAEAG